MGNVTKGELYRPMHRTWAGGWKWVPKEPQQMAPPEKPVCDQSDRCVGCPYPGHGFICWGQDGECMRTIMDRKTEKEEKSNGDSNYIGKC